MAPGEFFAWFCRAGVLIYPSRQPRGQRLSPVGPATTNDVEVAAVTAAEQAGQVEVAQEKEEEEEEEEEGTCC